jgi:ornithine--oxo-acid transaminase
MDFSKAQTIPPFGGYPLACMAGIAALTVLKEEKLAQADSCQGKKLKKRILQIAKSSSLVKEIRGKGLFIGIEINNGKPIPICRQLLDSGVLANDSHRHTI